MLPWCDNSLPSVKCSFSEWQTCKFPRQCDQIDGQLIFFFSEYSFLSVKRQMVEVLEEWREHGFQFIFLCQCNFCQLPIDSIGKFHFNFNPLISWLRKDPPIERTPIFKSYLHFGGGDVVVFFVLHLVSYTFPWARGRWGEGEGEGVRRGPTHFEPLPSCKWSVMCISVLVLLSSSRVQGLRWVSLN